MTNIVDKMLKRILLISCRVAFDEMNRLAVSVQEHEPSLSLDEYGRLWAAYHTEVLETLGYPTSVDAILASAIIEKITDKPFSANTDFFKRAGLSEVVEYTENPFIGHQEITGRFYAQKQSRFLVTDLRLDIDPKHLMYGSAGLLQFAANRCWGKEGELAFLFKFAKTIVYLLSPDSGYEKDNLRQLHNTAYALVKQLPDHDEETGAINHLTDRMES